MPHKKVMIEPIHAVHGLRASMVAAASILCSKDLLFISFLSQINDLLLFFMKPILDKCDFSYPRNLYEIYYSNLFAVLFCYNQMLQSGSDGCQ
jgi:hypothetical protein